MCVCDALCKISVLCCVFAKCSYLRVVFVSFRRMRSRASLVSQRFAHCLVFARAAVFVHSSHQGSGAMYVCMCVCFHRALLCHRQYTHTQHIGVLQICALPLAFRGKCATSASARVLPLPSRDIDTNDGRQLNRDNRNYTTVIESKKVLRLMVVARTRVGSIWLRVVRCRFGLYVVRVCQKSSLAKYLASKCRRSPVTSAPRIVLLLGAIFDVRRESPSHTDERLVYTPRRSRIYGLTVNAPNVPQCKPQSGCAFERVRRIQRILIDGLCKDLQWVGYLMSARDLWWHTH